MLPVQLLLLGFALAVQALALLTLHERVTLVPWFTLIGPPFPFALRSTVGKAKGGAVGVGVGAGVGFAVTDKVTERVIETPLELLHLSVNVLFPVVLNVPVDWLPPIFLFPVQAPLATQGFTVFELLQVNVAAVPVCTEVGLTDKLRVGDAGGGVGGAVGTPVTFAVTESARLTPAEFLQVNVQVLLEVIAPVEAEPEGTAREPLHAPLAVQLVAFDEVHVKFALSPFVTVMGPLLLLMRKSTVGFGGGGGGVGEGVGVGLLVTARVTERVIAVPAEFVHCNV